VFFPPREFDQEATFPSLGLATAIARLRDYLLCLYSDLGVAVTSLGLQTDISRPGSASGYTMFV